jgi:hypothetical protein
MFRRNFIGRLIGVAAGLCAVNRTAILNIGLADVGARRDVFLMNAAHKST